MWLACDNEHFDFFSFRFTHYSTLFFSSRNYYSPGSATLYFDKRSLGVKSMEVVFDSGSTYTYFAAQPYQATVSAVDFNHNTF